MNRFAWESGRPAPASAQRAAPACCISTACVASRSPGIDRASRDDVLALLAIRFCRADAPAGIVELVFAGGGTIRLDVECIEARLADLGAAWAATSRPRTAPEA